MFFRKSILAGLTGLLLISACKNEDNKKNIIDYKKVITRRDRSRLAKAVANIHDKLGDDYIYTVKFDKKAIKELDNWAKASSESDEDIARAERIAHVMDKIDMEIVTSETAIYK